MMDKMVNKVMDSVVRCCVCWLLDSFIPRNSTTRQTKVHSIFAFYEKIQKGMDWLEQKNVLQLLIIRLQLQHSIEEITNWSIEISPKVNRVKSPVKNWFGRLKLHASASASADGVCEGVERICITLTAICKTSLFDVIHLGSSGRKFSTCESVCNLAQSLSKWWRMSQSNLCNITSNMRVLKSCSCRTYPIQAYVIFGSFGCWRSILIWTGSYANAVTYSMSNWHKIWGLLQTIRGMKATW